MPRATTPRSRFPATTTSQDGARAASGSSAVPTSVWTTHASQKSFSSSVANATSKVVVSPGESRTLMKSSPTRWKRFDLGAMILTACGRESALRSVTSAVYTVSASASLKHTAGGNIRSHGSGFDPSAMVRFSRPRNRALISDPGGRRQCRSTVKRKLPRRRHLESDRRARAGVSGRATLAPVRAEERATTPRSRLTPVTVGHRASAPLPPRRAERDQKRIVASRGGPCSRRTGKARRPPDFRENVTFGNRRWRVAQRARGPRRTTSRSYTPRIPTTRGVHPNSALSYQNSAEPGYLGNGMTSLMFSTPVTYCTSRSNPRPNPACGTDPYLRRSRYHQ